MSNTRVRIVLTGRGVEGQRALRRVLVFVEEGLRRAREELDASPSKASVTAGRVEPEEEDLGE